ncbi:TetR/AcrR family transcriptional regulator [Chimaeribacter arupi]|uniref:TetR/AcrR family transcriptional regulator n=1 Tax=Chimaeribacter arupi TaxID=2060066 RepID=UPI000C7C9FC1|nr:TetR/AcrR family transcriptional regulator [Chimaeribacter arupi]PLR32756.1 TetR family transcriptional regulator [Chimaeribacter arupi]
MSLSPAAQKISDAAVLHFTENGYDAASLSAIADAAGIRKATIYSHFKNKDELFLQVFSESLRAESEFVAACFSQERRAGEGYLSAVAGRYSHSPSLRLLLRTAFVPPSPVRQEITRGYEAYLNKISDLFRLSLMQHQQAADADLYCDAYIGIIDSVHIELLYATHEAAERRRESLWKVFTLALSSASRV